jgi:hypothetical protein
MTNIDTHQRPYIQPATATITLTNRWDHLKARWRINRFGHRVDPGLYALGSPSADSPVFVTANYTLSFDELRSVLSGIDCYILVLDTKGVNVWCAAGKGTFATDELVSRIEETSLRSVVNHRTLILPQLGATGVAAHEVKKRSGFAVEYGPVRARDIPQYLKSHQATSEMRRVRFLLKDRIVLIPVELVGVSIPMILAAFVLFFIGGPTLSFSAIAAFLTGAVLFPILLPWIPTPNFSTKGFILGGIVTLPFALKAFLGNPDTSLWQRTGEAIAYLLTFPPVTAYIALNFTGATPITSKSGVKHEMFTYLPVMAWMLGCGLLITIALISVHAFGGAS